jgi:hypothetical protein
MDVERYRNRFRPEKVLELLIWRKKVNHLYNDIEISRELIHDASDIENHIIHGDGEKIQDAVDLDIPTRFNQRAEDAAAEGDNQEVCNVIVSDVNPPDASTSASKTLVVETSRSVIKEYDPVMLTMMFPELYIYGRCGIDEQRVVQTSVEYEIAKCLRLYNRRFAQSQLFLAVAFNFLRRIKPLMASSCMSRASFGMMKASAP